MSYAQVDAGTRSPRHYFVDEAGDGTLFNRKGKVVIGNEGCSRFFILGTLSIADPPGLTQRMEDLRNDLLTDPYFKGVPSMQPESMRTAVGFHATDDPAEVRREVFRLLTECDLRFVAAVRDKHHVLEYVRGRNERDDAYRYSPDELYDSLARRVFRDLLHKDSRYEVCFATRGRSDRTQALRDSLMDAQKRFDERWTAETDSSFGVWACQACRCSALQAVDYFLWALQRLYERGEERYVGMLWEKFRLVMDVDDVRENGYGTYYNQKRPLDSAALSWRSGI